MPGSHHAPSGVPGSVSQDSAATIDPTPAEPIMPSRLGRYRIIDRLGSGGFGTVYRGSDDELRRDVAIKVPHRRRVATPQDMDAYLAEARVLAGLDHPHIVPVFDVGRSEDGLCFIVSKFIEGSDLAKRIAAARPAWPEAAELTATAAEALHYAHKRGLVHRDVKPGNILIDSQGQPYLADFGLALKDEDYGRGGGGLCGTPAYMSPEQANGEGHRVDGRSDIFSLGVVFYELLTGRRPFRGEAAQILIAIVADEPRPPRQIDDAIPKELERICLKALSKRAADRYTTAKDMAADLRHFLAEQGERRGVSPPVPTPTSCAAPSDARPSGLRLDARPPSSDQQPLHIVPKGLRCFDAHDADFFLELLPGPRDREGLPDSIRFWKTRLEQTDTEQTFPVGLIYGPSGCGKSSLVKAGLLPRLADKIISVYVEATALETETRLLNGLRKCCQAVATSGPLVGSANQPASEAACGYGLKDTLAALRRGQGLAPGTKVLIVLDQFEQWLFARKDEEHAELIGALRQCDGNRVQCIVMVRDDFWLAVSRFLRELEVRLVEGQNSALADLFDKDHARKVLAAFGRAFGKLPENAAALTKEQRQFLEQAVAGLAQENKVVCVRLALFAEMMKGRPWTPAALKEVGGTEGVGVTFLEETFSAATAPPEHRIHQKAARGVLNALLPESGTDIKGNMRSQAELLAASGYAKRLRDFDDLLRILDSELRLITPTDPEGVEEDRGDKRPRLSAAEPAEDRGDKRPRLSAAEPTSEAACGYGRRCYQLTHDYLVPSLRDWLTRKQKETRRGRAELMLADRAVVWNARPENRQLPSLLQWCQVRWLTAKKNWTAPQRKMMRQATRVHLVRGLLTSACLLVLALAGWEGFGRLKAHQLRDQLLRSKTADVPGIVREMAPYHRWTDPLLRDALVQAQSDGNADRQLRASLALLHSDSSQVDYLLSRLLTAGPQELLVIRELLAGHKGELGERLWAVLEDPAHDQDQRFRAACALADFTPDDPRWQKVKGDVAARLVIQNDFVLWAETLDPLGPLLLPELASLLQDEKRSGSECRVIASLYKIFAGDDGKAFEPLEQVLVRQSKADATEDEKTALAKRQANVGAALIAVGRGDQVWPLLKHSPDPTVRSLLIDRLAAGGALPEVLLDRFVAEADVTAQRAILLSLGELGLDRLSEAERRNLTPSLLDIYEHHADAGLHAAADWLLRLWGADNKLEEIDDRLKQRTSSWLASAVASAPRVDARWFINGQGQTMIVIPRPGVFWMGEGDERHQHRIKHSYAIAAKDVTVLEFQRFRKIHGLQGDFALPGCPATNVTWHDAAAYCNWLSRQEGIPPEQRCYEIDDKGQVSRLKENYLSLKGYRLPTEAEWEYACRAGAQTAYSFGDPDDLLRKYAWYSANASNKTHPVGTLKPNDLGLFDMHGNAWQWCHDAWRTYQKEQSVREDSEDSGDIKELDPKKARVLRGGAWNNDPRYCRCAFRINGEPAKHFDIVGFRVMLPLDSQ